MKLAARTMKGLDWRRVKEEETAEHMTDKMRQ